MIDQNNLLTLLSRLGVRYEESCPLSRLTSFRIGGPARIAVFPESPERAVGAMGRAERERSSVHGDRERNESAGSGRRV